MLKGAEHKKVFAIPLIKLAAAKQPRPTNNTNSKSTQTKCKDKKKPQRHICHNLFNEYIFIIKKYNKGESSS